MSSRADRSIIYSFIDAAIEDAARHMSTAREYAFDDGDVDAAIDRCLRALSAIREAEENMSVSSDIVTRRKKTSFDRKLDGLRQILWCLTKDISRKTRMCYTEHQKSRVLRMQFLAYSWQPQDGAEAVGG
jgi:hypothetical protein